jgi:hypothetical protein
MKNFTTSTPQIYVITAIKLRRIRRVDHVTNTGEDINARVSVGCPETKRSLRRHHTGTIILKVSWKCMVET